MELELDKELEWGRTEFVGCEPMRSVEAVDLAEGFFESVFSPSVGGGKSFLGLTRSSSMSAGSVGESKRGSLEPTVVGGRVGDSKAGTAGVGFFDLLALVCEIGGGGFAGSESRGLLSGSGGPASSRKLVLDDRKFSPR